jgi:hypothetical protein
LCKNPNAIKLIEKILQTNPYNFPWWDLVSNPNGLHLIKKYCENIKLNKNYYGFFDKLKKNPNIFENNRVYYFNILYI